MMYRTEHYSGADLRAILTNAQLSAIHDSIEARRIEIMDAKARGVTLSSTGALTTPVVTLQQVMTSLRS
jgi:ATP-dependent 26S proteasome regulatory subunit